MRRLKPRIPPLGLPWVDEQLRGGTRNTAAHQDWSRRQPPPQRGLVTEGAEGRDVVVAVDDVDLVELSGATMKATAANTPQHWRSNERGATRDNSKSTSKTT